MANSAQSRKRARQVEVRNQRLRTQRTAMRTTIKKLLSAIAEKQAEVATKLYRQATSQLDRLARKNVIKRNKANRLKSRLNQKLKSANDA